MEWGKKIPKSTVVQNKNTIHESAKQILHEGMVYL